jgi:glycosyltransferase involved in cell wall biosynthesis
MNTAATSLSVVIVHERFPPDYGGGGEYVVLETAKHLMARGHRVRVVTTGAPADNCHEGVSIRRLPISRYRFNLAWRAVAEEARDADLIHCFTNHGALPGARAGRALGKPVVLGVLALFGPVWQKVRGPVVGRAFQAFESLLMRQRVARRIFLSQASMAEAAGMGCPRDDDIVVPPGISLGDYQAAPDKHEIVFSGKLDPRKGTAVVLRVARELPQLPFRAVVWGDGFDAFSTAAPPNLRVERFTGRPGLARALSTARIFLFPSKAETFGLAVAEAMASGCAIVGSAPIDFEGERIDPDDPEDVHRGLLALWTDPERCTACGLGNIQRARVFDWHSHTLQLEDIYRAALAPKT